MDLPRESDVSPPSGREGKAWATAQIYDELKGPITAFVRLRGVPDPDDVVSETFLQLFEALPRFVGDASGLRALAFTIARRRVVDAWRSEARRPKTQPYAHGWDVPAGDAEQEATELLISEETAALLDRLTDAQREIVLLRIVADLSIAQTAKVTGRTTASVKILQHRALSALRESIRSPRVTPPAPSAIPELR